MKQPEFKKFEQIFDPLYTRGANKIPPENVFQFTWEYCGTCQCMYVRCPKCGNNCCSGAFGRVTKYGFPLENLGADGVVCDVCNLAYQYQDLACKTKTAPEPTREQLEIYSIEQKNEQKFWENLSKETSTENIKQDENKQRDITTDN